MKTTGVKDVPKKILLVFLRHPNDDAVVDEAALRIKYLRGKMGLERGKSPKESRTTPIDNFDWGTFQAGNITNR